MRIIVTSFVSVFLSLFSLSGLDSTTAEIPVFEEATDLRILLVSSTVRDEDVLSDAAADGVIVIRYEARETSPTDLLDKVREALGGRKAATICLATHDYGHASFYLAGSEVVSLESIRESEAQRSFWREVGALVEQGGRIDILACKLAADAEGERLIAAIEEAAGVNVAASSNMTGNERNGGDWVLETDDVDAAAFYFDRERLDAFSGLLVSQTQKVTGGSSFGFSVDIDGDYTIVGEYENSAVAPYAGAAFIYYKDNGTWVLQATLTASDGSADDSFGKAVSISGDYAVIGAPGADDSPSVSGAAYVFLRSGSEWTQIQKLEASDGEIADRFGNAVSICGDYAAVSAPSEDEGGNNAGAVYVFERSESTWTQVAKLMASDIAAMDHFGYFSISLSGNYLLVGAYADDDGGDYSGSAYIFYRDGGTWTQQAKLTASDADEGDNFGYSVALSGSYAIIGALLDNEVTTNSGAAYVFSRSGTSWTERQKILSPIESVNERFGWVSIEGDYAVVGASNSNHAYLYHRSVSIWIKQCELESTSLPAGAFYGVRSAISGDDIVVGAPWYGSYSASFFNQNLEITDPTAANISLTKAKLGANVVCEGWSDVTQRGVVWSTSSNPDVYTNKGMAVTSGTMGTFTVSAGSLSPVTTYYYRGFVKNGLATAYTAEASFTTAAYVLPTVESPAATNVTETTATLGANVTAQGSTAVTARGIVWSKTASPTLTNNMGSASSGSGLGSYTVNVTGLSDGTTYYFRGYATNSYGTSYSNDGIFTTGSNLPPTVANPTAANVTRTTATLGADVTSEGTSSVTARGIVWSKSANPTLTNNQGVASASAGTGSFAVDVSGLSPKTTYYFRGYATNSTGTSYSADGSFTTLARSGSLMVAIGPSEARSAGAAWRLSSGSTWRASGYTETGLTPGEYTVVFKQIDGWAAPANRTVTVEDEQTAAISVNYYVPEHSGELTIGFASGSAVLAGVRWRVRDGADVSATAGAYGWHGDGDSVVLEEGTYTIEFLPVPGWIHLETEVTLKAGKAEEIEVTGVPFLVSGCTDFDGDGCGDIAVFNPTTRVWTVKDGLEKRYGLRGSWPTSGDYDGDGSADLAYWSPKKGTWRVRGLFKLKGFGEEGDLPVPGDYDGDGVCDPALYRPSTGEWMLVLSGDTKSPSKAKVTVVALGGDSHDVPVPADYDGDGKIDTAVFNIETRTWRIAGESNVKYGHAGELPIPGDYNGDGTADFAVVNLEKGTWRAKGQFNLAVHCEHGHFPLLLDYDADGLPEPGYYCFEEGRWHVFTFGNGAGHDWITEKLISFGDEAVVPISQR